MIQHISAVTFAVRAMPEALTFYTTVGFTLILGGPQSSFSTLQGGEAFVNLTVAPTYTPTWWGRTIFRVEDVDALYQWVCAQGLLPAAPPQNARWGERYFHLTDPNGHELSFAQRLPAHGGDLPGSSRPSLLTDPDAGTTAVHTVQSSSAQCRDCPS